MAVLSIVIPAYNEERFIGTLLKQIKAVDLSKASDVLQKEMNKSFLRILIERLSWANNRLSAA